MANSGTMREVEMWVREVWIERDRSNSFLHGIEEAQTNVWNFPFDQVVAELTQDVSSGRRADEPFHLRFFRVFRSSIMWAASDRRSFQN